MQKIMHRVRNLSTLHRCKEEEYKKNSTQEEKKTKKSQEHRVRHPIQGLLGHPIIKDIKEFK